MEIQKISIKDRASTMIDCFFEHTTLVDTSVVGDELSLTFESGGHTGVFSYNKNYEPSQFDLRNHQFLSFVSGFFAYFPEPSRSILLSDYEEIVMQSPSRVPSMFWRFTEILFERSLKNQSFNLIDAIPALNFEFKKGIEPSSQHLFGFRICLYPFTVFLNNRFITGEVKLNHTNSNSSFHSIEFDENGFNFEEFLSTVSTNFLGLSREHSSLLPLFLPESMLSNILHKHVELALLDSIVSSDSYKLMNLFNASFSR